MAEHVFEFKASISKQGNDMHIHLPRKSYNDFKAKNLLNKKLSIKVTLTEIES